MSFEGADLKGKQTMTRYEKLSRAAGVVLATVVVILTLNVTANAVQFLIFPQAVNIPYNLAAGASSAPFTTTPNFPTLLMGVGDTFNFRGVGFVHILRIAGSFIEWTGADVFTGAITSGFSGVTGTHIVYLDFSGKVDVQVSGPDSMLIHNAATATRVGSVTLLL
jgi:hypothetical protein